LKRGDCRCEKIWDNGLQFWMSFTVWNLSYYHRRVSSPAATSFIVECLVKNFAPSVNPISAAKR